MNSEQAYALCRMIEELPASEKQTQISVMASALREQLDALRAENASQAERIAALESVALTAEKVRAWHESHDVGDMALAVRLVALGEALDKADIPVEVK